MKTTALGILALLLMLETVVPLFAEDVHVRGYHRRDGTYVQPHMRSTPDSSYNNTWSTSPNVNPYTGQQGTREPRLYDSIRVWVGAATTGSAALSEAGDPATRREAHR